MSKQIVVPMTTATAVTFAAPASAGQILTCAQNYCTSSSTGTAYTTTEPRDAFMGLRHGKPMTGMQTKPDDKWTVPLNGWCHRLAPDAQHSGSEEAFWARAGKDPFEIADALWLASGGPERASKIKPAVLKRIKTRKPIGQRKKIQGRSDIPSRPFQKREARP